MARRHRDADPAGRRSGFDAVIRDAGHEPVALLTILDSDGRYGLDITPMLTGVPRRARRRSCRRSARRSRRCCVGRAGPRRLHGLPVEDPARRTRGAAARLAQRPSVAPAAPPRPGPRRVGDPRTATRSIGITFHRMDAELDTGPILAQRALPIGELVEPDEFYGRTGQAVMDVFREALDALAAGEEGRPQEEGGEYESFFTDDDAWLDPAATAAEVHRLVWAWRFTIPAVSCTARSSSSTARRCACSRRRSPRSRAHAGSSAPTGRSGSSRRSRLRRARRPAPIRPPRPRS